jgi:hypothetical protein
MRYLFTLRCNNWDVIVNGMAVGLYGSNAISFWTATAIAVTGAVISVIGERKFK